MSHPLTPSHPLEGPKCGVVSERRRRAQESKRLLGSSDCKSCGERLQIMREGEWTQTQRVRHTAAIHQLAIAGYGVNGKYTQTRLWVCVPVNHSWRCNHCVELRLFYREKIVEHCWTMFYRYTRWVGWEGGGGVRVAIARERRVKRLLITSMRLVMTTALTSV